MIKKYGKNIKSRLLASRSLQPPGFTAMVVVPSYSQPLFGCRLMVFTSAILLIGRRQVGEETARAASTGGGLLLLLLPMSCSVLDVTSDGCCSDMSSTLTVGGGDATFGGTAGAGGGDCGLGAIGGGDFLGVAPRFLVAGSGVAGVVERTGIEILGCSSLLGGGGSIP